MRNVTKQTSRTGEVSYLVRISAGYDINGKQIKKSMTWKPSVNMTERQIRKELERQAVMFEDKVRSGFILDGNTRFFDYAAKFIEVKELSPKCKERYISLLERINAAIGHIRLEKLQPHHLQEFYKNLRSLTSERTGKKLSDKTILHYHRLISSILTQACKEQIIPRNVAAREYMDAPKVAKKEPAYLDDKQAKEAVKLLYAYDDIRAKTAILLLIYTGMRRGELCGLEWSDVDFDNNTISVGRATQYAKDNGLITKLPKNDSSIRTMKIAEDVFALLKQYRLWQLQQKFLQGDRWLDNVDIKYLEGSNFIIRTVKNDRIFTSENGGLISPDTINFWLDKFREKYNLPHFSPHSLRHTNITLQITAGVPLSVVSKRSGHAQISTTSNIYAHAIKSADEIASDAIDDILTPKTSKTKIG